MDLRGQPRIGGGLSWAIALALFALSARADNDPYFQTYCSTLNTATNQVANTSLFQTNSLCSNFCRQTYAFAVVQFQSCWCSNYIPAAQESVGDCNQICPGWKYESCGSASQGLFGYIASPNVKPLGTAGAVSSAQTSTTESAQVVSIPVTFGTPVSTKASITSTTSSSTSSTSSSASSSSSPTAQSTSTSTTSPVKSIEIITVSGAVVTKTVTSTPIVLNGDGSSNGSQHTNSLSGGAIAGIVIGVLGGIAAILAIAFFLLRRRGGKNGRLRDPNRPRRTTSVLSGTGLLTRHRAPSMAERDRDDTTNAHGSASARHSGLFSGLGDITIQPASPLGSSHGENDLERRNSRPLVYDQRLNPSALYANAEANGSRASMQDQHDYSRPLGIANPDPRPSFESRHSRY